jgi:hypothetical protein
VEKQVRGGVEAIKVRMFHASMKAEMDALESRKAEQSASAQRAGPPAKYFNSISREGRAVDRGTQLSGRPPGSSIDVPVLDQEDRFDV